MTEHEKTEKRGSIKMSLLYIASVVEESEPSDLRDLAEDLRLHADELDEIAEER